MLWLFLLLGLQARGLHFPPGASGPSFSIGPWVSAVSVAREEGDCPDQVPTEGEAPPAPKLPGGNLNSRKACLPGLAWEDLSFLLVDCKYQDCSLQMPGTLPQLQPLTLDQQVTRAISTYRPSFCTHACQLWRLGTPEQIYQVTHESTGSSRRKLKIIIKLILFHMNLKYF